MRHIISLIALIPGLVWAEADAPSPPPPPITDADYPAIEPAEAALGQLLFYDSILSGGHDLACATCHHPAFGTSDGLSLGLGDGGIGLGPARHADPANLPEERVARNSQALWNVGALEYSSMFMDGRVEQDASRPHGMRTPLAEEMLGGLTSMLATQAMFPVVSPDEMAGHYAESDISKLVRTGILTGPGGAWDVLARRVAAIPAYAAMFAAVYPERVHSPDDITFQDISNAIAGFMAFEFRSDTAPFDAFLRGQEPLPAAAQAGYALFYGQAGCSGCHSGPFLTDHAFHAMGEVQIGPGKAGRFEIGDDADEGRAEVTGLEADMYAFRTPSLRNVALTAPYGHAGAYGDLAAYLGAHTDYAVGLENYYRSQAVLPDLPVVDWQVMDDPAQRAAIADAVQHPAFRLSEDEIAELIAFLDTLTDPVAQAGRLGIPAAVPSGLEVPRR